MTLPTTPPDTEPEDSQELSRITVAVGDRLLDFGLPPSVSVGLVAGEVLDIARSQESATSEFDEDDGEVAWTFARPNGVVLKPGDSLADSDVRDGDVLVLHRVGVPAPTILTDSLTGADEMPDSRPTAWSRHGQTIAWSAIALLLAVAAASMLPNLAGGPTVLGVPVTAAVSLAVGIGCCLVVGVRAAMSGAGGRMSTSAIVGLPLILGGALYLVPGVHGLEALPMGLGLVGLVALLMLLQAGRGDVLWTAVVTAMVIAIPAAVARCTFDAETESVGAVMVTAALAVIYLAPGTSIVLSRLPIPGVPTAGEPLDDIEIQGGTAVDGTNAVGKTVPTEEGMADRVRQASRHLTGIMVGAAFAALVACYLVIDVRHGFHWQSSVLVVAVATGLCLRGRSHHDLVQAGTLIGAGLSVALILIAKIAVVVDGWQVAGGVALIALTAVAMACGILAPGTEFSPVMRRLVEVAEYLSIMVVIPLACWVVGIYAYFRELHL